ncbi:MAG: ATP-binding cassette domain-containing protein [Pseudomonadota bacterium]
MIRARGLIKHFGDIRAVDGVDFDAPDGRITGILGANGAGKSTILRVLATVLHPDAGRAWVDEHDVAAAPQAVRRNIGVLPHDAGLYGRLTARENVAYFAALHGMSRRKIAARVDALTEQLDMGEFADRRAAGFSQGQRLKVALARALVHDPRTVILDEPSNGLDVMATRALRGIIRGLRAEGRCVVFSSHVMQEVAALCDQVVIVAHGRVPFAGTLGALRQRAGETDLEDAFVHLAALPA